MSPLIPLTVIIIQIHMAFGALLNLCVAHFSKVYKMYLGITHLLYLKSANSNCVVQYKADLILGVK